MKNLPELAGLYASAVGLAWLAGVWALDKLGYRKKAELGVKLITSGAAFMFALSAGLIMKTLPVQIFLGLETINLVFRVLAWILTIIGSVIVAIQIYSK